MKAVWNNQTIAETNETIVVEGNHYFPPEAVAREYFSLSEKQTVCPWKGTASYYTVEVAGKQNKDAAWFYPDPKAAAQHIKNYIAFWRGVTVVP